ncbi:MAG: M16 family metallopeptidase [Phycisphaeraceae bacterium]
MPVQFRHHQLDNGLTLVAETDEQAHTSAVGFFVRTGARDETGDVMGVSHFLEHMMFKGTDRRTADDVNREFDEIGANYNAFTSHEQTVYYAQVLPEFIPRAVDLLGDMLRPALREEDFDMEKKVILEEISMYDDRPEWRLQDTLLEDYFGDHPLGYRVLGTQQTVGDLTAGQMRDYFERRYAPDNIVLAAAGNLDFDRLVADADKLCGSWQASGAQRDTSSPPPADRQRTLEDTKTNRSYLAVVCPAPAAADERRYAMKVLSDVLGDSDGSRLYWSLVDTGLADDADFSYLPMDGTGVAYAYASCDPARADEVEEKLHETLRTAFDGFEEDELVRAKNKVATQATLQGERPMGRMQSVGRQWQYLGQYIPLEQELGKLQAVTLDDLATVRDAFPFHPQTTVRLRPAVSKVAG